MTTGIPARRLKFMMIGAFLVTGAVLIALSPSFGRAQPSGDYRPELPPDALTNGCYPLPAGVTLDLPYQVRRDGDVTQSGKPRRRLVLQYDLIDADAAAAALTRSFVRAGFRDELASTPGALVTYYSEPEGSRRLEVSKPGVGKVSGLLVPLSPLADDQIVRGTITLDLPVVARASDDPICSDPASTKRFAPEPQ